jgi:ribosomal protein S27AE
MVKAFTVVLLVGALTGVIGCEEVSPLEGKLIGTWGFNSISGEVDYTFRADHTWAIGGDPPLRGGWRVEGDELVSYLEPPRKEYATEPEWASLLARKREKIVRVTIKRLLLMKNGSKFEMLRMRCPRCEAGLGSFATCESFPTQRSSCPKCGFKLDDM